MEEPEVAPDAAPAERPRSVAVASVCAGLLSMYGALHARGELAFLTEARGPARDFLSTFQLAMWESARARLGPLVATEVAWLVASVLLFIASSRVLVKVRDAGWLWRQALAANAVAFVARAAVSRAFASARVEAFDRVAESVGGAARLGATIPEQMTPQQFARVAVALSVWINLGAAVVMAALLVYASRPSVRDATG